MALINFIASTHLQKRFRRLAKNPCTTHGYIVEFDLSIIAVEIFKESAIFIFFAMGVVIEVCFKTHG